MTATDVILGLLHRQPFSGYEIKHAFQTLFSFFFDASYGTIYPTLSKMEKQGYITKESIPQENRPVKHVYSLTDKGRAQFRDYLRSPLETETFRSDLLVRLYFGEYASPETAAAWIDGKLEAYRQALAGLEEKKRRLWASMSPTQRIVLSMGIEQHYTQVRVLEDGLNRLQTLEA